MKFASTKGFIEAAVPAPSTITYPPITTADGGSLVLCDIVEWTDTTRQIATEWRLDGELVRRDAYIDFLVGQEMNADQEDIG